VTAPLSLQQLSRKAVHAALQQLPRTAVPQLPLPETLHGYLLYSDLNIPELLQDLKQAEDKMFGIYY
jgi:hypothetical protein